MANIKFSGFTEVTSISAVQEIVGYNGTQNVRITPANFLSSLPGGPFLPLAGGTMTGVLKLNDGVVLQLGTSADLQLFHESDNSFISNFIGDLTIRNLADDKDIIFQSDDGSGGLATYFFLDGSAGGPSPFTVFPDSSTLTFGTGYDLRQYHNGTDSFLDNYEGNLNIRNLADNKDIIFQSDNGSGGVATYLTIDGLNENLTFSKPAVFPDGVIARFGNSSDLQIYHDGSNSVIKDSGTGNLVINAGSLVVSNAADTQNILIGVDGAEVRLYYNGSKKFETTSTGASVEGGLDIYNGTTGASLKLSATATAYWQLQRDSTTGNLNISDDALGNVMSFDQSTSNVGIGTTTPATKLHIADVSTPTIRIEDTTNNRNLQLFHDNNDSYIRSSTGSQLIFQTDGGNDRMLIDTSGIIGIGTDGVFSFGTGSQSGVFIQPASYMGISVPSGTTSAVILRRLEDGSLVRFYNSNSAVGNISVSGLATVYSTSSDYRLKEDLQDFKGLDLVSKIPVYDYKWKSSNDRGYGVMAHELQEVLPDAVNGEKDAEEMQGVDYSKIVPLLIKSIQELSAKVKELESKQS